MKLLQEVTFDSLSAIRQELHEWVGNNRASLHGSPRTNKRDMLLSIVIHNLADELSDPDVRTRIHSALSELNQKPLAPARH